MRITVLGAVLIIAAVAASVFLLLVLKEHIDAVSESEIDRPQQNPFLPNELST